MSLASLKGNASGTGTVTLESPNTNTDRTISLPDATGTVMVSGNMPAFSAWKSTNQTPSSGVFTKVTFDTEIFDTNSNFASSTFTPTVAGYYQINSCVDCGSSAITRAIIAIYKNGTNYQYSGGYTMASTNEFGPSIASVVYCNGTTDYIDIYARIDGSTVVFYSGQVSTWFNASLVRAA